MWQVLLLSLALVAPAGAAPGTINVQEFGAKGNGHTDDTEAIRTAMKAAAITRSQPSPLGVYYQTGPTLVFPSGEYLVSDAIVIEALEVRGEGRAVLRQTNPEKDLLTSLYAWRLAVRNLTFLGGRNQLDLRNPNVDTGQIVIENCRFYGAAGFGVFSDVLSTTVKIEDCTFLLCAQAWCNKRSDQAVMRDCWITSHPQMENKAVIEHRAGRLTIENLCGVPLVGGPRQRWIDNYGSNLSLLRCRFGGEGGGFTPVYNHTKYAHQFAGPSVVMEDCFVSANASYGANCAVYCLEVPNTIRLRNCQLGGCAGVLVDPAVNLATYFRNAAPTLFSFAVEGCTGEVMGTLPAGLRQPRVVRDQPARRILTPAQCRQAMARAKRELATRRSAPPAPPERGELAPEAPPAPQSWGESVPKAPPDSGGLGGLTANGHRQKTRPGEYVALTRITPRGYMDATAQPNSDWLYLGRVGDDLLVLFRQTSEGGWPHFTIDAEIDVDRTPWLTWRQLPTKAPGSFALKVIDVESRTLRTLYAETFSGVYDYHAHNLRELFQVKGKRRFEIRYYPLGWGQKTAEDFWWAQPGQYVAFDFFRAESD